MIKIFYRLLFTFWLFDLFDFSFMQMFDTTVPINGLAWLWIWLIFGIDTKEGD